jgi:hypothetical protein
MRKALLTLTVLASLTIASIAQEATLASATPSPSPTSDDIDSSYLTEEHAKADIERLFADTNPNSSVISNSAYVERTFNGKEYLLAKALVSSGNPFGGRIERVMGFVISVSEKWMSSLPEAEYSEFLQTGNVALLRHPPNLDPNNTVTEIASAAPSEPDVDEISKNIKVQITKLIRSSYGDDVEIYGTALNTSTKYGIKFLQVKFNGEDINGNLVADSSTYATSENYLRPGQKVSFHGYISDPQRDVRKVQSSVKFSSYDVKEMPPVTAPAITASSPATSEDKEDTAANDDLEKAWHSLTPKQQAQLRQEERSWIKQKDSLSVAERNEATRKRAKYLWSFVSGH